MAAAAERLGYDTAWVHDYIVWTKELDRTHVSCGAIEAVRDDAPAVFFESLVTLAYVAAMTRSIRLGTAVLILPYRSPIVTAKQLATLDVLSEGRLILGVGVGARRSTHNQDFEVLGIDRVSKYERTREYIDAMRAIWTERYPSFNGDFVRFPPTELDPKPAQLPYPPIWIGGASQRALAWVAEFGDGWLPAWLTADDYRARIRELRTLAESHRRDASGITIGTEIVACVAETAEKAHQISGRTVETLTAGFTVRSEEQVRATSLVGSVDEVRRRIEDFVGAGVAHFELKFVYRTLDELFGQMQLFADRVAPSFT